MKKAPARFIIFVALLALNSCGSMSATNTVTRGVSNGNLFSIVTAPLLLPFAVVSDVTVGQVADVAVQDRRDQEAERQKQLDMVARLAAARETASSYGLTSDAVHEYYACYVADANHAIVSSIFGREDTEQFAESLFSIQFSKYVIDELGENFGRGVYYNCVSYPNPVATRNAVRSVLATPNITTITWSPP